MDVIDMGVEMMDSCEVINYYLTRNGEIMDKEEFGMSTWDLLTDEQKVAQVRSEVEAKPVTQVDPAWEKAMNDLADEKQALRDMLDNLVTLWSFQAPLAEMESAMLRASVLLKSTKTEA